MKNQLHKTIIAISLIIAALISVIAVSAVALTGKGETVAGATDAMVDIKSNLDAKYLIESHSLSEDGYIGIPIDIHVYYDKTKTATSGYYGTTLIMYVVNTNTERVGTDTDVEIMQSMLDRGFIVGVVDYKNNTLATGTALDFSIQIIRNKLIVKGNYLTNSIFPSGTYRKYFVVPSGHNVLSDQVFWEADKHSSSGTLEEIVDIWNSDFKGILGSRYVKWTYTDDQGNTVRKKVESNAVWYSSSGGAVDQENGEYTQVKYTIAEDITDCVNPDGTPIDLNLYINIIYPTNPGYEVPVMAQHNSSGSIYDVGSREDRPHFNGFLFGGYAGVTYDYLYIPMAKDNSFGYFDGNDTGYVTGDPISYSADLYSDKKINTAAMRYIRYLSLSDSETYQFDLNAIGVYGVSKGGTHPFLGEAVVQAPTVSEAEAAGLTTAQLEKLINDNICAFTEMRMLPGHYGESRYQNGEAGYTRNGVTIDAGELQPWLTYDGEEIISGAQFIYASCPNNEEDLSAGHAPTFMSVQLGDTYYSASYGTAAHYINLCRTLDIPSAWFAVDEGHTNCISPDVNYGVVTLQAFYDCAGYYLKHDTVKVLYISPLNNANEISTTSDIIVKFTGPVSESEISKVVIKSADGTVLTGSWSALFGNTEWTFSPDKAMKADSKYTVTVPAGVKGDNGKAMQSDYVSYFTTEPTNESSGNVVTNSNGTYITATVPKMENYLNSLALRFYVSTEDAANAVNVYAVSGTSATTGELVGTVNFKGAGFYSLDVSEYLSTKKAGDSVCFLIKQSKAAAVKDNYSVSFDSSLGACTVGNYAKGELVTFDGKSAAKLWIDDSVVQYPNNPYYLTPSDILSNSLVIKSSNITESDYGRHFTISVNVYDTVSRRIVFAMTSCDSAKTYKTLDTQAVRHNFTTVAGEWTTFTFDYVVYDSEYGLAGNHRQALTIALVPDGCKESPVYIDSISVKETITDVNIQSGALVAYSEGDYNHKDSSATKPLALYNASGSLIGEYSAWNSALNDYKYGYTLRLQCDYAFENSDSFTSFATLEGANGADGHIFNIDLNGYVIYSNSSSFSLFYLRTNSATYEKTVINVSNGSVILKDKPLISYTGSTASGAGKTYDLNFTGVNIILDERFTPYDVISDTAITAGCTVTANINMTDCLFHIENENMLTWNNFLFSDGIGSLTTKYTIAGGTIKLDSFKKIKLYESLANTTFAKNSGGEYTTLVVPSYTTVDETSFKTAEGHMLFTTTDTTDGWRTYKLTKTELSTLYGVIPKEYADIEKYPFVIFDANGVFKAGTNLWGDDSKASVLQTGKSAGDGAVAVLRRDYVFDGGNYNNLSQVNGTLTIDLNGFTLTATSSNHLFNAQAKTSYPSTIVIKNGTLLAKTTTFVKFSSWQANAYTSTKDFTIVFEDLDIGFTSGGSATAGLFSVASTKVSDPDANGFIKIINCDIDLATNSPGAVTLFNTNDTGGHIDTKITIVGSTIKANSLANVLIARVASGAVAPIVFEKGSDGKYMKLYLKDTTTVFDDMMTTSEDGYKLFRVTENVDADGYTECLLDADVLATEYGIIPQEYVNNTFLLYVNGECAGASDVFYGTTSTERNSTSILALAKIAMEDNTTSSGKLLDSAVTPVVVFRGDYAMQSGEYFDYYSQMGGTVIIDLDGHKLTQYGTTELFRANCKPGGSGAIFDTTIIVKDGAIVVDGGPLINMYATGALGGKNLDFSFADIDFSFTEGSTAEYFSTTFVKSGRSKDYPIYSDITFSDCSFDLKNAAENIVLFNANDLPTEKFTIPATVRITLAGGNITADSLDKVTVSKVNSYGSSFTYARGALSDMYTTLTLNKNTPAPTESMTIDGAKRGYVAYAAEGDYVTYALGEFTKYGVIPIEYDSPKSYPFVLFYNGNCVFATPTFIGNGEAAKSSAIGYAQYLSTLAGYSGEIQILFRANYNHAGARFDNLSFIKSPVLIDLNGYKLSSANASPIFQVQMKSTVDPTVYLKIVNGNISLSRSPLISYSVWGTSTKGGKKITVEFEDVNISYAAGSVAKALVTCATESTMNATASVSFANVIFTNCSLDLSNVPEGYVLVNATDTNYNATYPKIRLTVGFRGSKVVATDLSRITWFATNENDTTGSSVVYSANSLGQYLELHVPKGTEPLSGTFRTTGGSYVFGLKTSTSAVDVYTLMAEEFVGYEPEVELTLSSDFVYRVYLPVSDALVSVKLNGTLYDDLARVAKKTIGDKEYYVFTTDIPASAAADSFILQVQLQSGDKTVKNSWALSVVDYAIDILESDTATEAEKTMVKDMLSYVKTVYLYFGMPTATDVATRIDAILGESYDEENLPDTSTEPARDVEGFDGAHLRLDAVPSFVFYPETNESGNLLYSADSYKFFVGETQLESEVFTNEDGVTYIVVKLYAYAIADTISYTIEGTDISGSYNLKSYYEVAVSSGDEELVYVITRLFKYAESAKAACA